MKNFLKDTWTKTYNKYMFVFSCFTAVIAIFIALPRVVNTIKFDTSWDRYCTEGLANYPCGIVKKYPNLSGNVFATYEWGGFLIWQYPSARVFADGRMPAWHDEKGNSPYEVYLWTLQTRPGWNERLRALNTDYLLIAPGTFMDLLLQKKENQKKYGWEELHRTKSAVLYKNSASN